MGRDVPQHVHADPKDGTSLARGSNRVSPTGTVCLAPAIPRLNGLERGYQEAERRPDARFPSAATKANKKPTGIPGKPEPLAPPWARRVGLCACFGASTGLTARFFRSRWEKLGQTAGRKYDCVLNDSIEWCPTRRALRASAKGIHSVLKRGGTFLFEGSNESSRDTEAEIADELKKEGRFQAYHPVHERDGLKLTVLNSRERIPHGLLGNRIHIVEEAGNVRVEVASTPDIRRWTWADYVEVLTDVGFRDIRTLQSRGTESLNAATK